MQKLLFVNSNGESIDLTSGHYGITKWNGFSNANLNLQTQQVPYQDGSVFIDGLLNNRELSVTLAINDNNDLEKRYELRNELIHILNPKLGEGYLYYKNDYLERRIKVIPQLPVIDNKNSNESGTVKASLSWTACGVYWEDVEETSVNINMGQRINIENKGDIAISPKISFNCNSALNPVLRNLNNGKKVSINGTLSNSVLNLEKGKKTFLKTKYGFTNNNNYNNYEENDEYQYLFSTNCISRTKDFENFETIYIMPSETVLCSGYGRGLFFYGGDNLKKSIDCITWETITEKPSGTVQAMYYDKTEDVFYFGIDGHLYSTSDLTTFTDVGNITAAINAITRHGTLIVGVGNGGRCFKYDRTNFTEINTGTISHLFSIASDGTNLVIGGGTTEGVFMYSTDNGDNWNNVEVSSGRVDSICYSNTYGIFFACGDNYVGKGLPNNMVWEELGTEARSICKESKLFGQIEILGVDMVIYNGEFKKICNYPYDVICGVYFKGKYIAAGAFGHIYTSENYTWWEESSASGKISNSIYFAEIANDTAYFFTKEGDIIYTSDGVNFNFKVKLNVRLEHIAYFNGYYYGTSNTGLYKFDVNNLENMELVQSISSSDNNLVVINNKLIVLALYSFVITSDGTTWDTYSTATNHSAFNIVFYNNKYIYIDSDKSVYETTDFENYTEILTEYKTESEAIQNILCGNNEFFFNVLNAATYEGKLYKGYSSPVIVREGSDLCLNGYYANNKYIFNYYEYEEGAELQIKSLITDFDDYSEVNDYFIVIDNGNEYHIDSDNNLILNDVVIHNIYGDANVVVFDGLKNNILLDHYNLFALPSGKELTSSIGNISSVYSDEKCIYIGAYGFWKIENNIITKISINLSPEAISGDKNYIYIMSGKNIYKSSKLNPEELVEIGYISSEHILTGPCQYYNNYLIYATADSLVAYNLQTNVYNELSTNIIIEDIKVIDNTVFAIGQNGFLYSSDMKNITELYKTSFVFTTFVRNDLKKFIALYGALGELIILEDENIISMITDISFELQEGENEIVLNCDSGYISATLSYHQLYLGV